MRVYVLGAGASVHASYPLASALGTSMAAWIGTLPLEDDYRFILNQIIDAYEGLGDFEAVLADLMTCLPGSVAAGLKPAVRSDILRNLKEAVRRFFDTIRVGPAPLYDQLACSLTPGDVVLTFNYDLGIERSLAEAGLWDVRTGYGFAIIGAPLPSPIDVLKLHGSTNWRALLFEGRTGYFAANDDSLGWRPVLLFRPDQEYLGFPAFVDPRCGHLASAVSLPAMIMPALPKRFYFETMYGQEWKPFWDGLWQRAQSAIENAEELIVIGYSLPVADERARDLLLGTANKSVRLTICCGRATTSIEQEFRDHGFAAIRCLADPTFEGLLTAKPA